VNVVQTIPILRIFDVVKAEKFYLDFLGFQIDWESGGTPNYLQISRESCVIHLSEHYGDCCPGSTVFVWVTGLTSYWRELTSKDFPYMRPGIEAKDFGANVMEVIDPFGNRLRFSEDTNKAK